MTHPYSPDNNLKEVSARYLRALASSPRLPAPIFAALIDIPSLSNEVAHLRLRLSITRLSRANLAAAACATLTAIADHERDPLYYLRDELASQYPADRKRGGRS